MATSSKRQGLWYTRRTLHRQGAKDGFFKRNLPVQGLCKDVAMKVTTDALRSQGGTGYMKEFPIER